MSDSSPRLDRICLIAMKGTLDRLDSLLSRKVDYNNSTVMVRRGQDAADESNELMVRHAELKAVRDDLWSAWFELNDKVK